MSVSSAPNQRRSRFVIDDSDNEGDNATPQSQVHIVIPDSDQGTPRGSEHGGSDTEDEVPAATTVDSKGMCSSVFISICVFYVRYFTCNGKPSFYDCWGLLEYQPVLILHICRY